MRPLLTATLVARDHARFVEAAIASVRALADEIVVVDAGSADGGADRARAAGARVVAWSDGADMAGAWNRGLEEARGDWALILDAAETVHPLPEAAWRVTLTGITGPVADVEVRVHPAATPYRAPRLVRRESGARFRGPVNPTLDTRDRRVAPLPLVVERRDHGRSPRKARADALMHRLRTLGPERVVDWCHLARLHAICEEPDDAGIAWEAAVTAARAQPGPHPGDGLAYAGLIRWRVDRKHDVGPLIAEARAACPDDPELRWLAAEAAMRDGAFDEAIALLDGLLADAAPTGARARPYDRRLLSLWPHAALGHCHERRGRHAESLRHFEQAAALDPWCAEFRVKAHLAACRAGRRAAVALPAAGAPRPHVFVHIPKTAGLAVNDILWRNEAPGQLAHYWTDVPAADLERLRTVGTISGHFPWGLHARLGRPCSYITFLREPLARILSHYAHHRNQPDDPWHRVAMTCSIVEWADRVPGAHNVQVQFVAGRHGAPGVETLKTALENLPGFAVVGLTDRYEESVTLMARRLGLARPHARVVNEGRTRTDPDALPRSARLALDRHIALDRELYVLGQEILAERLAALGPGLEADLAALRVWEEPLVEPPAGDYA